LFGTENFYLFSFFYYLEVFKMGHYHVTL